MEKEENILTIQLNRRSAAINEIPKILDYCLEEIKKYQLYFYREPDNSENLHQLRIKIRQYRSILSFFKPLLNQDQYLETQKFWRRLGKNYAYLRELDVLLAEWQKTVSEYPDIFGKDNVLGELLLSERAAEINKLCNRTITDENMLAETIESENVLIADVLKENSVASISLDSYAKRRIGKWLKNIHKDWTGMDKKDIAALHALRIKSKKIRYVLELFLSMEKTRYKRHSDILKDLQENLGEICDINRNIIAMREIDKDKKSVLIQFQIGVFTGMQIARLEKLLEQLKAYHLKK